MGKPIIIFVLFLLTVQFSKQDGYNFFKALNRTINMNRNDRNFIEDAGSRFKIPMKKMHYEAADEVGSTYENSDFLGFLYYWPGGFKRSEQQHRRNMYDDDNTDELTFRRTKYENE